MSVKVELMEITTGDIRISGPLAYSCHISYRNAAERSENINFLSEMTILSNTCSSIYYLYRSIKKVISLRNVSKSFFIFFFKYINGLSFTIHVIRLSCKFVSINHINV